MMRIQHNFYPGSVKRVASVLGMPQSSVPSMPPPPGFAASYTLYIESGIDSATSIILRQGALLEWNDGATAFLAAQPLNNGLFDWLAQGVVPGPLPSQGQLLGTSSPIGSYGNTEAYITAFTISAGSPAPFIGTLIVTGENLVTYFGGQWTVGNETIAIGAAGTYVTANTHTLQEYADGLLWCDVITNGQPYSFSGSVSAASYPSWTLEFFNDGTSLLT